MYEQNSFVPVARVVQLASHLQQKRLANIAYETRRFVRIGESDVVINQRIADKSQPIIKIYHYHCNHLGTPQELSDDKGDIVWLSYDRAWGESFDKFYKSQFIDNYEILAEQLQPFKFQGQFFDTETSLHYNRFRYYDSDVGMFVSRDPIELLGGFNVFEYASNPIIWIDEFGLKKYHRKDGTWGKKRGRPPKPKPKSSHGNSDDNPNCTTLYRLNYLDKDYTFSKWGVTSNSNPLTRYSSTELGNRVMTVIAIGKYGTGNRATMKQLERLLVESHPGPDNNEAWAGKGHDKRTPEEIISDFASKNPCVKIIRKS